MADTATTFAGIHNENEFYGHHYLCEIFTGDIRDTVVRLMNVMLAAGGYPWTVIPDLPAS